MATTLFEDVTLFLDKPTMFCASLISLISSDRFHVSSGVRQGSILSPSLFTVFMNMLMVSKLLALDAMLVTILLAVHFTQMISYYCLLR